MNIEIANRLVNLRKNNNLSQEALASKLGISRQAVSKWERAEASPDTDNLILLARLYGVSLDDLLKTEDEIPVSVSSNSNEGEENTSQDDSPEYVHVGLGGVHVKDKDGSEVHVGWDGIHVDEKKRGDNVHIDKNGVYVNGEKYDKEWFTQHNHFPFALLITVLYLFIGIFFSAWHPGWMLFLLIPLWHSFISAVKRKNAHIFSYPVVATIVFLFVGFFFGAWHPGWVVFLTIPLYYAFVSYFKGVWKEREYEDSSYYDNHEEE